MLLLVHWEEKELIINLHVLYAEAIKQWENYMKNTKSIISLIIWPILMFFTTLYSYSSFNISYLYKFGICNKKELIIFLVTGAMIHNCFWSMVQGALVINRERESGTLEIVFMSPANRLALMYGNAFGGIFNNLWVYAFFSLYIIAGSPTVKIIILSIIALLIIIISTTIWGGFINSLFLISRDSNILFCICDEPMKFFSGTKIPFQAFPTWGKIFAMIFPATYCTNLVRSIYFEDEIKVYNVFLFVIIHLFLILATYNVLLYAERRNRVDGGFQFY